MHAIMHRHDQLRLTEEWRIMMRHMQNIDILASKRERNGHMMCPQRFFGGLIELLEIRRQRTKLVKVSVGADQQILILYIDLRQVPYEIPNIRSNTEFVDLADIDCNTH